MTPAQEQYRTEFLQSDFWKMAVAARRVIAQRKCELCGSKHQNFHGHHLVYRNNWYDTQIEDIRYLCEPCHIKAHEVLPMMSAHQVSPLQMWERLEAFTVNHQRMMRLLDAKRSKEKTQVFDQKQFWLKLTQEEGELLRSILKEKAVDSAPEFAEKLRELNRLILKRMRMAEKKVENRKKRWESTGPQKRQP